MNNLIETATELTPEQIAAIKISERIYEEMYQACLSLSTEELEEIYDILMNAEIDNYDTYALLVEKLNYNGINASPRVAYNVASFLRDDFLTPEEKEARLAEFSSRTIVNAASTYEERIASYGVALPVHYNLIDRLLAQVDENWLRELFLNPNLSNVNTYTELMYKLGIPNSERIITGVDKNEREIISFIGGLRSRYLTQDEVKERIKERMRIVAPHFKVNYANRRTAVKTAEQIAAFVQRAKDRAIFSQEKHLDIINTLYNDPKYVQRKNVTRDWRAFTDEFNRLANLNVTVDQLRTVITKWKSMNLIEDNLQIDLTESDIQKIIEMLADPTYTITSSSGGITRDYNRMLNEIDPNKTRLFDEDRLKGIIDKLVSQGLVTENKKQRIESHVEFILSELLKLYKVHDNIPPEEYKRIAKELGDRGVLGMDDSDASVQRLKKFIARKRKFSGFPSIPDLIKQARS